MSEQIGVSSWYDWADVPVVQNADLSIERGTYTAGEPAVRYRGIFLNDEAPSLTGWVKNTYGTNYGDHRFYARVFELLLRLRGNFMWPAMWSSSFYADDTENSRTADDMGVIMGTSHHEPMARNHQEWARNRSKYGVWDCSNVIMKGCKFDGTYHVLLFKMRPDTPQQYRNVLIDGATGLCVQLLKSRPGVSSSTR